MRWRLPGLVDRPARVDGLFDFAPDPGPLAARLARWEASYGFEARLLAPEIETVREALGILDMVETALDLAGIALPDPVVALDVGARNWFYVRALWALLRAHGQGLRTLDLTGIEVDPFVIYRDGHSRHDWARLYSAPLAGARFIAGDFFAHDRTYDLVIVLFPFLNREEHLEMGLPLSLYRPQDLLEHALRAVRPGGTLLVTCFDYEQEALTAAWRSLGQRPRVAVTHTPIFVPTKTENFVTVLKPAP